MPSSLLSTVGLTCAVVLGTAIACSGETTDAPGTGGSPAATGGTTSASGGSHAASGGTTSGSGGGVIVGGAAGEEGLGGTAGAPALPPCGCGADSQVVIEFPTGSRVYELPSDEDGGCNMLTCEPETAHASMEGARGPQFYAIQACHPDGDCVWIFTGPPESEDDEGRFLFFPVGEEYAEEPVIVDAQLVEDGDREVLEFSFEANAAETDAVVHGSGRVCFADSIFICAI